jgi:hypothetical protein
MRRSNILSKNIDFFPFQLWSNFRHILLSGPVLAAAQEDKDIPAEKQYRQDNSHSIHSKYAEH